MDKKLAKATFWAEGIRFEVELRRYDDGRLSLSGMADGASGQVNDEIETEAGDDSDVRIILDAWEAHHLNETPDSVFATVAEAIGRLDGRRIGSAPDVDDAPEFGGDISDSRDVIKRLEIYREAARLIGVPEDKLDSFNMGDKWPEELPENLSAEDSEILEEFVKLRDFADEAEGYADDWLHGSTIIRESYFTEYAEQMVKDIGDMPDETPGYIAIDWDATAENLKVDYTEIEHDGTTYLVR